MAIILAVWFLALCLAVYMKDLIWVVYFVIFYIVMQLGKTNTMFALSFSSLFIIYQKYIKPKE